MSRSSADESRGSMDTPRESDIPQESGAADINTMKNRQNSEKARHPDKNDEYQALRSPGAVYQYGEGIRPPRPDSVRVPERGKSGQTFDDSK